MPERLGPSPPITDRLNLQVECNLLLHSDKTDTIKRTLLSSVGEKSLLNT